MLPATSLDNLYRWRIYSELIETIKLLRELFQISAFNGFRGEEML